MKGYFKRTAIVFFWLLFIAGLLYLPSWKNLFHEKETLNIFAWGDILEPTVIAEFEKKTGIHVNLNYFSSNEELVVKLLATGGEGYDLIIPSDYSVKILREKGALKEIQKDKLTFLPNLNPLLVNHSFDPENKYSIPFEWEIFVLGIDKAFFKEKPPLPTWGLIFDPSLINYRIAMLNDPVQALLLTSFYLYGNTEDIGPKKLQEVVQLLERQKEWTAAYADFRADYFLASKNCPVVVSSTSYILRTMRRFDFIDYVIPKEGTFVTIENFCIPKASQKEELAYALINFLYTPESMATHFNTYGVFPATVNCLDRLTLDEQTRALLLSTREDFTRFHFTKMIASQEALRHAWIEVKTEP